MPDKTTIEADPAALSLQVQEWVTTKSGKPLEYRVAERLEVAGLRVAQGRAYFDRVGDKWREIDVIARLEPEFAVEISLVVECKNAALPWVIFDSRGSLRPRDVFGSLVTLQAASEALQRRFENELPKATFWRERVPGIAVASGLKADKSDEGYDPAFNTLRQVVSAANGQIEHSQFSWALAWPIIVLGSKLFVASPGEDGDLTVRAAAWQRVHWHGADLGHPVIVDVVTEDGLARYLPMATRGLKELAEALEGALPASVTG